MPRRFLLDENVPVDLAAALARRGHEAAPLPSELRAADDADVLRHAVREDRVLVTLDTDFGTLVFMRGMSAPPAIVLIRLQPAQLVERLEAVVEAMGSVVDEGCFIVIDGQGVRVRPLPAWPQVPSGPYGSSAG